MARPKKIKEEEQKTTAIEDTEIKSIGGQVRYVATPDKVSVELVRTILPQQAEEQEQAPVAEQVVEEKKPNTVENIGTLLKPKSFQPLISSHYVLDLEEIDPTVVKEVQVSEHSRLSGYGEAVVMLYDSVNPNTRKMIEKLKSKMVHNRRWNLNPFDSVKRTSTNMQIRHLNGVGDVLATTTVKGLSMPIVDISGCAYDTIEVSTIMLTFYFESWELK